MIRRAMARLQVAAQKLTDSHRLVDNEDYALVVCRCGETRIGDSGWPCRDCGAETRVACDHCRCWEMREEDRRLDALLAHCCYCRTPWADLDWEGFVAAYELDSLGDE